MQSLFEFYYTEQVYLVIWMEMCIHTRIYYYCPCLQVNLDQIHQQNIDLPQFFFKYSFSEFSLQYMKSSWAEQTNANMFVVSMENGNTFYIDG